MMLKRFFVFSLITIIIFGVITLALYIRAFFILQAIPAELANDPISVLSGQNRKALTHTLAIIPYVSLGTYHLPYLFEAYQLAMGTNNLINSLQQLQQSSQEAIDANSHGNIIDTSQFERIQNNLSNTQIEVESLITKLNQPEVVKLSLLGGQENKLEEILPKLNKVSDELKTAQQVIPLAPILLGYDQPQHYYVLLQNNTELRPTGGFLGSFAEVILDKGQVTSLKVEDIYAPDGQVEGYVKEPEPVKDFIFKGGTPGWKLRDSNWNPDFPVAFQTIGWFFEKSGMEPADGMIALNLFPLLDVLKLTGGIYVHDYNLTVTSDNFYEHAQYQAENNFFPGSTQKRDFLSAVSRDVIQELTTNRSKYTAKLLQLFIRNLDSKQIMIVHTNPLVTQFLKDQNWDGSLQKVGCGAGQSQCIADYLLLNEANVGINKANCCIVRKATDSIDLDKDGVHHSLQITYYNNNLPRSKSPFSWGGDYKNFLRVFVPYEAKVTQVSIDGQEVGLKDLYIDSVEDKQSIGFLVTVPTAGQRVVTFTYTLPLTGSNKPLHYALNWQKQSGIEAMPLTITTKSPLIPQSLLSSTMPINGENTIETTLEKDTVFTYLIKP